MLSDRVHAPVFYARSSQHRLQWKRAALYALLALSLIGAMWLLRADDGCDAAECSKIVRSRTQPPRGPMSLREALKQPVSVAVQTMDFFVDPYTRLVPCTYEDQPFYCEYVPAANARGADALWYHMPTIMCRVISDCLNSVGRYHPWQRTVGFSMEGADYYQGINNVQYMDMFDVEMSYRLCSHVPVPYFDWGGPGGLAHKLFAPPLPWDQKTGEVVFVNANCHPPSNRTELVQALMQHVHVDAWGYCLKNVKEAESADNFDKIEVIRKYKFCITIENSVIHDYVTEKVWHGLQAGCIPIYYGAANIWDFVPSAESVIDYRQVGSPAALADLIKRLSSDREAYEARLAWKNKPLSQLLPGFQKLVGMTPEGGGPSHSQCALCREVIRHRVSGLPRAEPPTHCMRNESWLAAAAASTHIITADSLASQPTAQSSEARAGAGGTQDTRAGTNPLVFEAAAARRGSAWTPASDGLLRQLAHNTWPHDMAHPEPGDWGPLKGRVPG